MCFFARAEVMDEEPFEMPIRRLPNQTEYGGWEMKRLSLLVAVSALLVAATATTAQAQCVMSGPGAQVTVPAAVVSVGPTIDLASDSEFRRIPAGVNEVGRFPRYIGDTRLMDEEIQFKNRDFEAWMPLEPRSKERVLRSIRGNLRTSRNPVIDQEVGRLVRFIAQDDKMLHNNMVLMDRDFYHFKPIYASTSRRLLDPRIRGLAASGLGTIQPGRLVSVRQEPVVDPMLMRFY